MNGHMEDAMEYFAKSPNAKGHQETVKEHLQADVQQSALGYCTQLRKEAMEEEALWQHHAIAPASLSRLFAPTSAVPKMGNTYRTPPFSEL